MQGLTQVGVLVLGDVEDGELIVVEGAALSLVGPGLFGPERLLRPQADELSEGLDRALGDDW